MGIVRKFWSFFTGNPVIETRVEEITKIPPTAVSINPEPEAVIEKKKKSPVKKQAATAKTSVKKTKKAK